MFLYDCIVARFIGTLAEKALLAVLPPEDGLRYTIRINSEVMASDGSTSMATVCGGSMALMDAGIPLREHVAGVSVGLVSDVDPSTGTIKDYRILTDILGLEDHLGDMDFKIAGTRNGITAIQLDIKPAGIPLDIICESLEPAFKARLQILDHMEREINAPRTQNERDSPRIVTLKYSNEALRRLIGPLGALKRKIEEETGARISVSDGTLTIVAKNHIVQEKVLEKVDFIIGREIEVGGIYKGIVTSIKEYGAFVEFNGGQQGLLHISELSHEPVSRVSDVVSIGQQLSLKCIGQDLRGNIKLSLKETLPQAGSETNNVVEGSFAHIKQLPNIWGSVGDLPTEQGKQPSAVGDLPVSKYEIDGVGSPSPSPSILIRSAADCDEAEKSGGLNQNPKSTTTKAKKSKPFSQKGREKESTSNFAGVDETEDDYAFASSTHSRDALNDKEPVIEAQVNAKNLKLGTKVIAKVHQIRARGLVLDLGGGIHGMYRFETCGRRDFEVGDELQVKCSSFSSKGIPVMSMVEVE